MRAATKQFFTSGWAKRICRVAVLGLICTGFFAGCQLPNVGPFVDATGQLKGAVASTGAAVEQELRLIPEAEAQANELKVSWGARNRAMTGMLSYAGSLDAIVASGKAGAESAEKVAESVKGLAEAAGIAIPGSPAAAAVVADGLKFLGAQIAKIRATKQLARALDEAQPAVEKIADLMRKDLKDLDGVVQSASQLLDSSAAKEMSDSGLMDQRKSILQALKKERDLSNKEARAELADLSKLLTEADSRYAVYQSRLAANAARLRAARQLINAADASLDAWTAGHAQLAVAVRNHSTVNTGALVDAALELRGLVKRIREL